MRKRTELKTEAVVESVPRVALGADAERFRLLAITPFERADLRLARALARYEVAVALDLGRDPQTWPVLWSALAHERTPGLGLRIPDGVDLGGLKLPASVSFLILDGDPTRLPDGWRKVPVLAQVCSMDEARQALAAGVTGLIAKGQESGGRVGNESSFVLLQRLVTLAAEQAGDTGPVPVWCQGGIAFNTAAGAFAGGAYGVVIDSILATYPESSLPEDLKAQVLGMDGSEAREAAGYHIYARGQREVAALDGLDAAAVRAALTAGTLLPVGQDAALSRLVLSDCSNLEALVQTLRQRIAGQVQQAQALRVLDEGNAWARSHGVRYPVAQGPMTRVSDTAAFTATVAKSGGLPFLALSLMREQPCRELLEATVQQVGDQPWGVGLLGFGTPEILNPQLELVKQFKPSVLLLAGGRPSQARPFIEMGIPTYLHVPSPGLLDLFLKDGATHFVFEGRECGGHVGPRYSFVLWEQAIALLSQVEQPEKLHVLFAGGIHDERSSAMVAAIAAPLAARGAKIGVLMGTAYIATTEAVRDGAVLESFQQKAIAGGETALVETAPGHAIRCLPSGFLDLFAREKSRLQGEGIDTKQVWQQMEALTVGRLRIATKGVDYVDGRLAAIDAVTQEAEGMYMIGQVIALKQAVTTVADLHAQVTRGATDYLQQVQVPALRRATNAEPVAVVGMACIYPGSPDLESYWSNILEGRDLVSEVPAERWSVEQYYRGPNAGADKSVSKWGGFIADTPFDPLKFGIPPASLAAIEPVQLLSLAVAQQAINDAGYASRWFDREKTSVIFGAEAGMDLGNQYTFRNLYPQYCGELPEALAKALPSLTEDSFPGMLVNVISGRIANRLGLGGVNYSVTSACASSLTAIELGVKELRTGSSEMVLAGGADFHNGIADFLMFSSVGALSAKGRCRSFDNEADGICLGEGIGVVVLKRLADAERDGDRIYAVIDGIAGSSDGKGLGLTAPRKEGQRRALERTYWQAGVLPGEVGLVEAHGTGTVVGDRTELKTLTEVYTAAGAVPGQAALGSVKSQIGHTKCAAGIAGLIKVAKALHHRVLPPTGQITMPNAAWRGDTSPFRLNRKPAPWLAHAAVSRGAVSAFGFGGTNFHAVLSAYPAHQSAIGAPQLPAELFVVRGVSRAEAETTLRQLASFLDVSDAPLALRDLARTTWEAGEGLVQFAFVASDTANLSQRIAAVLAGRPDAGISTRITTADPGKLAFLFSGQGSQYPGMLRDLLVYFPPCVELLAAAREELPVIYPTTAYDDASRSRQQQALTDTRKAQPALGLVELAAFEWLRGLGLVPDMAAGHSYGELVALATAGAFDAATLLSLSRARAEAIRASVGKDSGAMAAVRLDVDGLRPLLAGFPAVVMANQNSPIQTVISGPTADVEAACAFLGQNNVGYKRIATDCAFHSPLMAAAEANYAAVLSGQAVGALQWPVYSNISAEPHRGDATAIRESLARHIVSPVRFVAEIERMHADGARVFLEVGPRKVLTGLVGRILKDQPHTAIALDPEERGFAGLLDILAQLAVLLPNFDAAALYASRAEKLDLAKPHKLAATTWLVNGGRAWPLKGKAPAYAAAVVTAPVIDVAAALAAPEAIATLVPERATVPVSNGELALVDYLSNMRELVNAQRDVLLGYFGAPNAQSAERTSSRLVRTMPALPAATPTTSATHTGEQTTTVTVNTTPAAPAAPDSREVLLTIVSERTGYPAEMLDLDLDLEADLSIDSIKRLEIIGELSQRLSLRSVIGTNADVLLEQLAAQKTLRAVLNWLTEKLPTPASSQTTVSVTTTVEVAVPASAPASPVITPQSVGRMLLDIVSQSTGYPPESLDPDLDLEADLSIDSIKRLEVVGQLCTRLGVEGGSDKDAMLEQLSSLKTLRAMTTWLEQRYAPSAPAPAVVSPKDTVSGIPLERYVLRRQDAPPVRPALGTLTGKRFLISDDRLGLAPRVAALLEARGVRTTIVDFPSASALPANLDQIDGLIHLWSLNPSSRLRDVKRLFAVLRASLQKKGRHLLIASALGGDFGSSRASAEFTQGAGLAGLVKTVIKEFPELRAHWVDFDLTESLDALARHIEQELLAENPLPEVAYQAGHRYVREIVPNKLNTGSLDGLPLTPESTVLITGGARGITALIAIELARRYRCHLEVIGRSPIPIQEEAALTRGIDDPRKLRQALLSADSSRKPAEIEQQARRILTDRAARETYAQVIAAGGSLNFTRLDVRDSKAFMTCIDEIYARRGHIDGVIHGAGVVEDKLVRDKTDESFGRVFDTKVGGALALNRRIRDDVKFVVFFSSVASAFGNKGQVDYASANDVLDKLAHSWQQRIAGRVLSVNWGPWAGTGMVSESLKNEYQRKGIGLIPQQEGVDALLRELSNRTGDAQVLLMCGTPESFDGRVSSSPTSEAGA